MKSRVLIHILKWTNHADLIRIKGIGGEYAELLEAAGVEAQDWVTQAAALPRMLKY